MIEQFTDQQTTSQMGIAPQIIKAHLLQSFQTLSHKSPSLTQLQRCHDAISKMMKQQLFFDISIALLLQFQHSPQYLNIPKLIITTLSTFLKHQQTNSRLVKRIDRFSLNRKLIDTFLDINIEEEYRVLIIKSYSQYIHAPAMETIRSQTVDLLCKTFGLISIHLKNELSQKNSITQEQTNTLMSYILVVRAITKGPLEHTLLKSIVTTYLPSIELLLVHFLSALSISIVQKNQPLFMLRSGLCCKLLQFWKQLVVGTSKDYSYVIKQSIMMDRTIKEIICTTLSLNMQQPNNQTIHQLVIESNGNKYVQRINQMKAYCVSVVNFYAKACLHAQTNLKQLQKDQYKMPLEICKYFIVTIAPILIGQFESLNYPSKDLPHSSIYRVILTALSNIVRINGFFQQAYQIRSRVFFNLCLPLLQRKEEEYTNGQQFKGKREDILNTHSMDIPENAACKLIESYIDRIDGSIAVFSSALANAIEFHLTANPNFFNQLPMQLTNSYFFKETDYMIQIECFLSVFALFSYMTIGREELVIMLQKLLVGHQSFFLNHTANGMFKASVLLTYSYYVDNCYANLVANKSNNKQLHLQIIKYSCNNIELFATTTAEPLTKEYLLLEIAALQSLDCITNSISQKLFLQALFWSEPNVMEKANNQYFYALFNFLIKQLYFRLNIGIMDSLSEFLVQAIRTQCTFGHAIRRFHYQYKQVALAIRADICNMICEQIYNVFNASHIPNHQLMQCKIINLLQLTLTCCQYPDQFMNHQFFALHSSIKDVWDIAQPIDIYLRRIIIFQQEGREPNKQVLHQILKTVVQLLQVSFSDYKIHNLFGIIVNLMVIDYSLIDQLSVYLSSTLIKLLKLQDQSNNYDQDLESLIEKLAFLNLIAIYNRFVPTTQNVWCILTESIQTFLQNRSTKGIIATKSIPYVGKLLAISMVCLYNMRKIQNIQSQQSILLWNNVLRLADVYTTITQKQIISSVLISLLDSQSKIQQDNQQCKKCFNMVSHLLYKAYSKAIPTIKQDYDNNEDSSSSGCDDSEDEDYDGQSTSLNYQQYKIANNQYTKRQGKEKYILQFKNICHKLKHESPQFILSVVDALSLPIRNFVKTQVFYYQSMGECKSQAIRKVIKVKKVIPQ